MMRMRLWRQHCFERKSRRSPFSTIKAGRKIKMVDVPTIGATMEIMDGVPEIGAKMTIVDGVPGIGAIMEIVADVTGTGSTKEGSGSTKEGSEGRGMRRRPRCCQGWQRNN
jgi:hypothetical protein